MFSIPSFLFSFRNEKESKRRHANDVMMQVMNKLAVLTYGAVRKRWIAGIAASGSGNQQKSFPVADCRIHSSGQLCNVGRPGAEHPMHVFIVSSISK